MISFQYIPIIPIIIPKIDLIHRINQISSLKKKHLDSTSSYRFKLSRKYGRDLGVHNKLNCFKVQPLDIMLVSCKASNIPIKDFKESIDNFSMCSKDSIQCHPIINEINDTVRINLKLKSGNIAEKIGCFLEIINENCSRFQNSTVINNWKVLDDTNGKKITIEINTLNNGGIVNIHIPSEKHLPVNLEYIKLKNSLSKNDLEAIHFLMKPSNYTNNLKEFSLRRDLFKNKLFFPSNSRLFGRNILEKEFIGNFEHVIDNLTRSIFADTLIDHMNGIFNSRECEINSSDQCSRKPEFLYAENNPNICNDDHIISSLEELGVQVYLNQSKSSESGNNAWDCLGGYEDVKRQIEEHIMLSFKYPDVLDKIVNGTRIQNDSTNRPKLILFEGPPGTGKTTSARIISNTIDVPLIYVSLENIVSKWYGESENRLAQIFDTAKKLDKGCVIFIDEIDTLASSRDKTFSMHEGSKKILSVLLRKLDGFDTLNSKTLLICATNRRKDIDEAFLNRIDSTVIFNLPNENERELIFKQYAKHLTSEERSTLAKMSKKLSGRSIRHICLEAEREWASMLLKEKGECQKDEVKLPPVEVYKEALKKRIN